MRISVGLKVESLLRDLRLAGHALAESAEMKLLRAVRQRHASGLPRETAAAGRAGNGGGEA